MLAITACQTTSHTAELNNTNWILTDWSRHVLPADKPVTIAITLSENNTNKNPKISGQSFCNAFNAQITDISQPKVTIGPVISTKMACMPDKMAIENDFLGQIQTVNSIEILSGSLVLTTNTGKKLIFTPA